MSVEWISQKLRRGYKAGQHLDPFELDLPRLGETRQREHRAIADHLHPRPGRVQVMPGTHTSEEDN